MDQQTSLTRGTPQGQLSTLADLSIPVILQTVFQSSLSIESKLKVSFCWASSCLIFPFIVSFRFPVFISVHHIFCRQFHGFPSFFIGGIGAASQTLSTPLYK